MSHFHVTAEDEQGWQAAAEVGAALLAPAADWFTHEEWLACFHDGKGARFARYGDALPAGVRKLHPLHPGEDAPDTRSFRVAILHALEGATPDAIILARDSDGVRSVLTEDKRCAPHETPRCTLEELARRQSVRATPVLAQAGAPPVLLAEMNPEAEAWVLAGFEPRTADEHAGLAKVRSGLGFDPTREPERCTSTAPTRKDAKAVLQALTGDDRDRGVEALRNLQRLRAAGGCGAADYVSAFEARVVQPLVGGRSAHP